ncbi:cyclin-like protein interacting with PHO85 [Malassezia cuniculi]|uniref:Cyclin-like protein interacting with PHO85 n=1 Tax=Malassezia cuniculi TaxID=948313 RepID=A0AAF0ERR7_9BASI|nr:cyclin-like protein interacting with PHO85 [Malassezia cuniculi]
MYLPLDDPRRPSTTSAALAALNAPSSTLCFHARNIPSISIEAYLLRILKYCPTSSDVFLSLLVYFDRMSRVGTLGNFPGEPPMGPRVSRNSDDSLPLGPSPGWSVPDNTTDTEFAFPGMRGFAIDSYNVHRLIIAGITVASKFFSDVFYTNSRYAKVGGLAVHELNQLELHFLLLNDFRLTIPMYEIQQYANQLLAYASERGALPLTVPRPVAPAREASER